MEAGETKTIKSTASGSFVSTNFDFDHPDLRSPATSSNAAGIGNAGKFTLQAVLEFAPDGNPCTVPGRPANAGSEFKLVGEDGVSRFTATGDLLFFKGSLSTLCEDFSTFPNSPFPVHRSRDRGCYWRHGEIFRSEWNLHGDVQRSDVVN
jgi:hypothetical protein